MDAIRFVVRGRVQGVGFRAWTRSAARETGVVGWVRNRPDGAVEIEAAGPDAAIRAFRTAIRRGPPLADVTGVEESPASLPPTNDFSIRY